MNDLLPSDIEQLIRARIGERVTLDASRSPYHGQPGLIVDTMPMSDGTLVCTVEWPDGDRMSYTPDRLRMLHDTPCEMVSGR